MGRTRQISPDGVLDLDRGGSLRGKRAAVVEAEEYADRVADRDDLRGLDAMVEQMPGMRRQQRDRDRAMPRDLTGDVPRPVMERTLPAPQEVRVPISGRQRKARSVTKHHAQDRMPQTQHRAVDEFISQRPRWYQLTGALSKNHGDVQALSDADRMRVQRLDRAIMRYEARNDRGHVIYANATIPKYVVTDAGGLQQTLRDHLPEDGIVDFDRYTAGAHSMHELDGPEVDLDRTAVLEIQTRRGMYLGQSDKSDDTAHLLPRGMRLRIVGIHAVDYAGTDGAVRQRTVVQLLDVGPHPQED